jgi:hypothetical protein
MATAQWAATTRMSTARQATMTMMIATGEDDNNDDNGDGATGDDDDDGNGATGYTNNDNDDYDKGESLTLVEVYDDGNGATGDGATE